jgi:hypothetical protein
MLMAKTLLGTAAHKVKNPNDFGKIGERKWADVAAVDDHTTMHGALWKVATR